MYLISEEGTEKIQEAARGIGHQIQGSDEITQIPIPLIVAMLDRLHELEVRVEELENA